jgi:Fe-S cluster assembly protein SufD
METHAGTPAIIRLGADHPGERIVVSAGQRRDVVFVLTPDGECAASVDIELTGPDARADVSVLILAGTAGVTTLRTRQLHLAPGSVSNLLVKSVVAGSASVAFDGLIRIEPAAQHSDAYQRSESLLLSETSRSTSKPTLEILANDVRCTHGAVTRPPSREERWYLSSRGIAGRDALALLTSGFVAAIRDRIPRDLAGDVDKYVYGFFGQPA